MFRLKWALLAGLLAPVPLWAGHDLLTLNEAIEEVLANNPDIVAAHQRVDAADARIPQAKALEDPLVGVTFEDVPIDTLDVTKGEEINYRVEQRIPFPGKRHVKGKAARFDASAVSERSQGQIQDTLLDLKQTYYDLFRLDRSLEVNRENQALLKQLRGSTEAGYATGKTTAANPLKIQVELSQLENQEILLIQERVTHIAHLKALLNRPSHDDDLQLPSHLSWPRLTKTLEEITSLAIDTRPELKELRAMENRDKTKLTSAKQGLIPDFSLGFEYNQVPKQLDHWTGTTMINLPVFFWGKNKAEIREAKAMLKATEAEHQSMEIHTKHEIEQAYSAVKAAEQIVSSYDKRILPEAKISLESARTAYASNQIDLMLLIDAARTYRDLQMSYYENQANLGMSFAKLERLVGRNL